MVLPVFLRGQRASSTCHDKSQPSGRYRSAPVVKEPPPQRSLVIIHHRTAEGGAGAGPCPSGQSSYRPCCWIAAMISRMPVRREPRGSPSGRLTAWKRAESLRSDDRFLTGAARIGSYAVALVWLGGGAGGAIVNVASPRAQSRSRGQGRALQAGRGATWAGIGGIRGFAESALGLGLTRTRPQVTRDTACVLISVN
jgi:hypothetical protein